MSARRQVVAVLATAMIAPTAGAQSSRPVELSVADNSIRLGRLADAESELYAASRRAPREPAARGALGNFLAARGQLKVGAVLLEEARQFGGDRRTIEDRLAHVYRWLGEWSPIASLSRPVADGEREMARWLARRPGSIDGPDSSVVALAPNERAGLGQVTIGVGDETMLADIDPSIEGVELPPTAGVMTAMQAFAAAGGSTPGVLYLVTIGGYRLSNVPVRLSADGHSRIGFDVLAPLRPTFDLAARRLTMRLRRAENVRGVEIPVLLTFPGVLIVVGDGQPPAALESAAGRAALHGVRWTFDLRRGAVIVER